jgi:hypothetical protein
MLFHAAWIASIFGVHSAFTMVHGVYVRCASGCFGFQISKQMELGELGVRLCAL